MLISYSKRFIFIHNYKVAGRSIKNALDPYSSKCPSKFHFLNRITEKNNKLSYLNFIISNKINFIPNF